LYDRCVRANGFLSTLATASLCFSVAVYAASSQTADTKVSATARPAAPSHFPKSLVVDGKQYDRLTGAALLEALHANTFCPDPQCTGIAGDVARFLDNGHYLEFGDRWEGEGRYTVNNDVVVVKLEGTTSKYAFYRSADGAFARAVVDRAGIIRSGTVFALPIKSGL
jgi:hypothetical protein